MAALTDVIRDVLGDAVLAAYLYGSAVAGGLGPDSDLDVLVVGRRSLTGGERAAIIQRLLPISGRRAVGGPARSIELTIVVGPALAVALPAEHRATVRRLDARPARPG
jgi:streptomycin 3"-adenylyltransferase